MSIGENAKNNAPNIPAVVPPLGLTVSARAKMTKLVRELKITGKIIVKSSNEIPKIQYTKEQLKCEDLLEAATTNTANAKT